MKKQVQENLEQYREHKFFNALREEFEFGKKTTDQTKDKDKDKKDLKPKKKVDPRVAQEQKQASEDAKNALAVVKK